MKTDVTYSSNARTLTMFNEVRYAFPNSLIVSNRCEFTLTSVQACSKSFLARLCYKKNYEILKWTFCYFECRKRAYGIN